MAEKLKPTQASVDAAAKFFPAGLWKDAARDDLAQFLEHFRITVLEEAAKVAEQTDRDGWKARNDAIATAIRSLSQPVEGSAGASVGPGYSAEPEPEETPCTSCNDTGWNFQTERHCTCGAAPSSAYEG